MGCMAPEIFFYSSKNLKYFRLPAELVTCRVGTKMAAKFQNGNYKHQIIVFFIIVRTHLIWETERK